MHNEFLLIQGSIFTPTSQTSTSYSWHSELLIHNNHIIAIGRKGSLADYYDFDFSLIPTIKIPNHFLILPGFIDCHIHPIAGSLQKMNCALQKKDTWAQASKYLITFIENNPNYPWIFASGYEDSWFDPYKNKSPLELLDELGVKKPITITRFDGHSFWCNSLAILQAGIDENMKDPIGGIIGKCKNNGKFNGLFHDESMKLIRKAFPKLTSERLKEAYEKISHKMIRKGITCFADASTKEWYYETYLNSMKEKNTSSKPQPIVYLSWKDFKMNEWSSLPANEKMAILDKVKENAKLSKLKADTIKLFIDGVIESTSAALKSPYLSSNGKNHGLLHYKDKEIKEILEFSNRYKFNMHYHVVGDQAFLQIVSMIEENNKKSRENLKIKHTLAHVQLVDEQDLSILPKNIALCFSPLWCYKDFCYSATIKELGLKRCQNLYPIKYFNPDKNFIGFGSDWPVSSMNPFKGIEVAVTRLVLGEKTDAKEAFCPEHKVKLEEAVRFYTLGAAGICGEVKRGSLEVGQIADLIVVDQNIFELGKGELGKIHETKVVLTILRGKIVYNKMGSFFDFF